jgi:triosephosphate isomerase
MYKLIAEAVRTAVELKSLVANANHCEVVIAPVFTALKTVADRLEGSNIRVAGQDCSTDDFVNRKALAALKAGLTVIVCVGETLEQRDGGVAERVVKGQVEGGLRDLTASDLERIIIAYEPVWAIGTGRTATPEQAQEMHAFVRRVFAGRFSQEAAAALRILYGGSVKPDNIAGLMKQPDVDGALVGGASLEAESFAKIVNYDR